MRYIPGFSGRKGKGGRQNYEIRNKKIYNSGKQVNGDSEPPVSPVSSGPSHPLQVRRTNPVTKLHRAFHCPPRPVRRVSGSPSAV